MPVLASVPLARPHAAHTAVLALAIAAIGVLCVAYNTFGALLPYADCINGALLFADVRREGLAAVASWRLPADNFLFVLHVFAAPWFVAFGTGMASLVALGTLLFLLGVAGAGALVARATHDMRAGTCALLLLFAIPLSIAHVNQSHPVGHGSTMIFVLLAAWLAADIVAGAPWRGKAWLLGGLTLAATVSDPWFAAVASVPLAVAALLLATMRQVPWAAVRAITASLVAANLVAYGALRVAKHVGWLQPHAMPLAEPQMIPANARSLVEALPLLFNYDRDSLPAALWWPFVVLGVALLALVLARVARAVRVLDAAGRFILAFAVLSMLAIAGAYLLTEFAYYNRGQASARYLLNVYYMAFIAAGIVLGATWRSLQWRRAVVLGWMAIFALPTIYNAVRESYHNRFGPHPSLIAHHTVLRTLEREGLRDGFAPYATGAVGANSLTWLAGDTARVRPVEVKDGRLRTFFLNANRTWYAPPNEARFLLVARDDAPPFEAAARAAFGPPARTLRAGDYLIFVWDRDVMPLLARQ
ncbi:MAG: hypothetical protein U1F48_10265 [Burkholderiales bacterium]